MITDHFPTIFWKNFPGPLSRTTFPKMVRNDHWSLSNHFLKNFSRTTFVHTHTHTHTYRLMVIPLGVWSRPFGTTRLKTQHSFQSILTFPAELRSRMTNSYPPFSRNVSKSVLWSRWPPLTAICSMSNHLLKKGFAFKTANADKKTNKTDSTRERFGLNAFGTDLSDSRSFIKALAPFPLPALHHALTWKRFCGTGTHAARTRRPDPTLR